MNDPITWAALIAAGGFLVTLVTFWMKLTDRISKSQSTAEAAIEDAKSAQGRADDAADKMALLKAEFSMYRETVAREYIHREVMREVEDRLTQAIDRLGDRFDRFLQVNTK